jgi:hypothetical protein
LWCTRRDPKRYKTQALTRLEPVFGLEQLLKRGSEGFKRGGWGATPKLKHHSQGYVHQTGRKHYSEERGRGFKERGEKSAHLPRGYSVKNFFPQGKTGWVLFDF